MQNVVGEFQGSHGVGEPHFTGHPLPTLDQSSAPHCLSPGGPQEPPILLLLLCRTVNLSLLKPEYQKKKRGGGILLSPCGFIKVFSQTEKENKSLPKRSQCNSCFTQETLTGHLLHTVRRHRSKQAVEMMQRLAFLQGWLCMKYDYVNIQ